jgi:predicted acetyltransferase
LDLMVDGAVRLLAEDEYPAGARLVSATMLGSVSEDVTRAWADRWVGQTNHGAFSTGGDLVGIARWFATDLSVDGASIPAAAVTAVAVRSTDRRQGHLRRLMGAQLESIAATDVPIALLVAAEWPIYGRYGYGPAVDACGYKVDATSARFRAARSGTVEHVSPTELRPHLEAVHDLRWARTTGAVRRSGQVWDVLAGVSPRPGDSADPGKGRGALWRDEAGLVQGAVAYRVEDRWTHNRPSGKIDVTLLVGATPEAERELWRHLCETDWISTVVAGVRSIDDPLPYWLEDGRAAVQVDRFDCIWARILNVPHVFGARRSSLPGRVVIDVVDDLGYANGRWALELGPDGADVTATSDAADVRLPVATLGAASLGGTSVARLHEAGWLDEESPKGVARLDALLHTPTAPWSPTTY